MPWVTRGLRDGVVTSRYPRRPDGYSDGFHGAVRVVDDGAVRVVDDHRGADVAAMCPTGAITNGAGGVQLDRGRCILCGRCVEARPDRFAFDPSIEVATLERTALVVPAGEDDDQAVARARANLAQRVRALRRSVHIRHVDAGSDGAEEWEIAALTGPIYDVQRLGVFFTASPRHADLLLVSGAGAAGMIGPLRRTWEAMPGPKIVLAAGTDAVSGGLVHPSYATRGGVSDVVPVDVWIPGSPPSPFSLLHGILLGVGLLPAVPPRSGPATPLSADDRPGRSGPATPLSADERPGRSGPATPLSADDRPGRSGPATPLSADDRPGRSGPATPLSADDRPGRSGPATPLSADDRPGRSGPATPLSADDRPGRSGPATPLSADDRPGRSGPATPLSADDRPGRSGPGVEP